MSITKAEIDTMSMSEKHELLEMLWESLEQENYIDNIEDETEEEKKLLQERLEDYRKNPSGGINWETLKEELLKRDHD